MQQHKGFTLLEVSVALMIFVIALIAILRVSSYTVANTNRLRNSLAARMVAQNVAAMLSVAPSADRAKESVVGHASMLGHPWQYQVTPAPTCGVTPNTCVCITIRDPRTARVVLRFYALRPML